MTPNQIATIIAALMQSEDVPSPEATAHDEDHGLCLVVADRGHVWVGEAYDAGDYTHILSARIVRAWGTEHGLNQLAKSGPTGKTTLDARANVKVARRAVIAIIPCAEAAWKGK